MRVVNMHGVRNLGAVPGAPAWIAVECPHCSTVWTIERCRFRLRKSCGCQHQVRHNKAMAEAFPKWDAPWSSSAR